MYDNHVSEDLGLQYQVSIVGAMGPRLVLL